MLLILASPCSYCTSVWLSQLFLCSVSQEAYVDSAALAESKLELQEERAAQGLSTEPTPSFEVEEVDDWEVR